MPSRAPQDDHMLKHVNKDIIRDAENAVRRSGMEPSAPENYDLLKQAVNDAATRSMYMRDPFTRSNRSPGAHDWTYESGLPYRSPLDRLYPRAEQDTWSRAEMLRALRSSKGEDQDQDLRPRDEWVAVSPPLQSKPHEYSYQSRYPRLRTDLTALNLNPLPSIWSNKLPPMKGSSPEVLNKHIQIPDSAPSKPEIQLVVNDTKSGEKFPLYLTRELFKVASPVLHEMCRSEENGVEVPCIIPIGQDFEAVQSLLAFASRGVCDTPFSERPLDHYRELMTLAVRWETPGLYQKAVLAFKSAAAELPSEELYRLTGILADLHKDPNDHFPLFRVRHAVLEAAMLRGREILGDGEALLRLAADGGGALVLFGKSYSSGKNAMDDTDESVADIRTPATTPPGTSSPASRSMLAHPSAKDHWASVGSKCYCEECMSKRRISRR
ncbi:hypothetical protein LTR91_009952 [Friedmanniomyces endolithicus]|uniref:BTB domain-containing protein n=1 Tax=Friedmanniomyces endolithicus TaxID=329885 RepID=A0AAN6QSP4_9PEZI|nr:hypothetical protein LTR94_002702 [Friedmanniomyces endolithicus]KAK0784995.1 hypothetical protein LTR38_012511 [Friedmanniomyces endolithicus]KAK0794567.1 hypothetical protein LTR59_007752 [Friedmanniomyces endolithicus]KAK0797897.1 hypothetical protein LTR75_009714 [Friedmanniomyces endolithicus]KAK0849062.1 hypothetical protein LTR03_005387 [Friedmanniomyces endolithicus]